MKPWGVCEILSQSKRSTGISKPSCRSWVCKGPAWLQQGSMHKLMQRKSIWTWADPKIIHLYSCSGLPDHEVYLSWAGSAYSCHRYLCICGIINPNLKIHPSEESLSSSSAGQCFFRRRTVQVFPLPFQLTPGSCCSAASCNHETCRVYIFLR